MAKEIGLNVNAGKTKYYPDNRAGRKKVGRSKRFYISKSSIVHSYTLGNVDE